MMKSSRRGTDSLGISPSYIHKDKIAHREALFTLGDEIVSHIHDRKSRR